MNEVLEPVIMIWSSLAKRLCIYIYLLLVGTCKMLGVKRARLITRCALRDDVALCSVTFAARPVQVLASRAARWHALHWIANMANGRLLAKLAIKIKQRKQRTVFFFLFLVKYRKQREIKGLNSICIIHDHSSIHYIADVPYRWHFGNFYHNYYPYQEPWITGIDRAFWNLLQFVNQLSINQNEWRDSATSVMAD